MISQDVEIKTPKYGAERVAWQKRTDAINDDDIS